MIDFAKSSKNQDALIAATIAYRKHPHNAEDIGGGVILSILPSSAGPTHRPSRSVLVITRYVSMSFG
jgi:hypothetical protein